ncbi:hypothetical protein Syncc9605_1237 [Synechococcus sp. CC9605]|nr:hypothetical protein Syncc9605_1237 [Synechococcus sp. CC9605]
MASRLVVDGFVSGPGNVECLGIGLQGWTLYLLGLALGFRSTLHGDSVPEIDTHLLPLLRPGFMPFSGGRHVWVEGELLSSHRGYSKAPAGSWVCLVDSPVVPVNPVRTKRVAVNIPMALYEEAQQMARYDRRTISQWFRVAVEDAIKTQKKRLKDEGIEPPVLAPSSDGDVVTSKDSAAVQEALKKNPTDRLLKMAADDIDNLGGVQKEKLQKLKLLMELLGS